MALAPQAAPRAAPSCPADSSALLARRGYVVLPEVCAASAAACFLPSYLRDAPELLPSARERPELVFRGGGKVPLASGSHHVAVRRLRLASHRAAAGLIRGAHPLLRAAEESREVVSLPDALAIRRRWDSKCKPEEQWHRDRAKGAQTSTLFFGGWLNLDDTAQFFRCAPGSHAAAAGLRHVAPRGFVREGGGAPPAADVATVEVPPGGLLVFVETLLHTILPHPCVRLFVAFASRGGARWGCDDAAFAASMRRALAEQAPLPIKSGDLLPFHPRGSRFQFIHTGTSKRGALAWAREHFTPASREALERWAADGGAVPACPSLAHLQVSHPAFPEYSREDLAIFGSRAGVRPRWKRGALRGARAAETGAEGAAAGDEQPPKRVRTCGAVS